MVVEMMIIRNWQENGEQMHMFQIKVYCHVCRMWTTLPETTEGNLVQCGNATCKVSGPLVGFKHQDYFGFYIGPHKFLGMK
jgi:hypothetical protein